MNLSTDDIVGPCKICGITFARSEIDKYYYCDGVFVCAKHPGSKEWYKEKLKLAKEKLNGQIVT